MTRTFPLVMAALLSTAGCDFGDMCFRDRCDPYQDYGECGPDGCMVCGDVNSNGNGACMPTECWCDSDNTNCSCTSPQYPYCADDSECPPEESCEQGWCTWQPPAWCDSSEDCATDQVCSAWNECRDQVMGCPLTDECLADPEGYVPEWMGIDPLYMGEASASGFTARVELLIDFYADHFYGDAVAVVGTGGYGEEVVDLIVTGDRSGANLSGQVVERNVQPRRFDAVFTAQLVTASEILGTVEVSMDEGTLEVPFHLYRVSPCGCDPATVCTVDADCPTDHRCVDQVCVAGCVEECCANADCLAGDECVNATCKTPCASNCDCAAGEVCDAGYCALPAAG